MSRRPRVLFYFLHLLGVGHVYRARRLIEGMAKRGLAVDVIYGGMPVPDMSFEAENVFFLSPIQAADNAYSAYLDENGDPLTREYQNKRAQALLEIFADLQPDLILTEAFPFGRRMVRHEMKALIDTAKARTNPPLIVSSVRDILQERKKAGRVEETRDWIRDHFDHVLVHSDPDIIKLDATYPLADDIADKLTYTGFVVPDLPATSVDAHHDVLVSAGGGAFGGGLMLCALQAAVDLPERHFLLSTGPNCPAETVSKLQSQKPDNVEIVTRLENLAGHMAQAKISISQCGYNTAMDVLAAHAKSDCRAVFVPYDTEGQTEQLRRAEILEQAGYAINLPQSKLNGESLIQAIKGAAGLPRVEHAVKFDGVDRSVELIRSWISEWR